MYNKNGKTMYKYNIYVSSVIDCKLNLAPGWPDYFTERFTRNRNRH